MKLRNSRTTHTYTQPFHKQSSIVLILVWWVFCFALCYGLFRSILSMRQGLQRLSLAQAHLQETEKIGLELLQKEQSARSALTKERIIRDELGLQKPGETVLQLPSSTQ